MHSLWRQSNSNWKISSASKWFQGSKNFTFFVGTFKSQLKNTDYYTNDYKDDRPWHSLLAHSNFNWKKLTYFVGTFKFQLEKNSSLSKWLQRWKNLTSLRGHSNSNWKKKQFSIEMISKMSEPYILCGDIQIPTEKTVQYLNNFKYEGTLHLLLGQCKFQKTVQY